MSRTPNPEPADPTQMMQLYEMMISFMATQAIYAAVRLGLPDLIDDTPRTSHELATASRTHSLSLARLLRMLASVGIFREDEAGRFHHTPLSNLLRSDHPQSMRSGAFMYGDPFIWTPWGQLWNAVKTGKSAFEQAHGKSLFEYLAVHPEESVVFDAAMTATSAFVLPAVLAAYDFSKFHRVADVGGGRGALLQGILSAYPAITGVLYDRSSVVSGAGELLGRFQDRCEIIAGDFFQGIPEGSDAYVFKSVIHDWSDEDAVRILRNCRRAIRPGGKLLLIERVLKQGNQPDQGRFSDIYMMAILGGRERTEGDFNNLLRDAAFALLKIIPTSSPWVIIEGDPV